MARKEVLVNPQWLIDPRGDDFANAIGIEVDLLAGLLEDETAARALAAVIDLAVERLPDKLRRSVEVVVWGRLSYRDAGALLECDPKTVWRRVQKAGGIVAEALESPVRDLLDLPDREEDS